MSKLRIGIIGAGQRTCFHGGCVFRECADEMVLAGLCDNKSGRLEHARGMYSEFFGDKIELYEDYRKMLEQADLDGVYISSPNHLHEEMALAALEKGVHVLCEKPMATSLAACDRMMAAAGKAGCVLGLGMQMHYRERYHKVREILESGRIGEPAMLWCTEYRGPFKGMKEWVWDSKVSGGAIVEKNCHHYDIFNLWLKSNPTTVYASGNIMKHKTGSGVTSNIVDNAWIINDYENGARGMIGICFLGEMNAHYREFGVHATEGRITFSSRDNEVLHVEYTSGDTEQIAINRNLRGGLFRDFLDSIREKREMLVTGSMGRDSLLVPLAAEQSIREKRMVHVSELEES